MGKLDHHYHGSGPENTRILEECNSETTPLLDEPRPGNGEAIDVVVTTESICTSTRDPESSNSQGPSLMLILSSLWIGVALSSLDASIVATVYPQIGTEFKRSNEVIWIASSYMLSYTAFQPLYGSISDAFGRKSAYLFAVSTFFVGSLSCGAANGLWSLVTARGIAGIGGGGMNTMSSVIMSDFIPLRERGKYRGYANLAGTVGSVLGSPVGGIITDTIGWRYCFYMNLPPLLISLYVCVRVLTNYNIEGSAMTFWQRAKRIDYVGSLIVVSAVVLFMLSISIGGNTRPWSDPMVISCMAASLILSVAFCIVEMKWVSHPLMPWHIISSRTPLTCLLVNFFINMCSFGTTYTTPLFYEGLGGMSASQAGLYMIPKIVAVSAGTLISGFYMSHTGEYRCLLIVSSAMAVISMVGYMLWTPETLYGIMVPTLVLDGFSTGAVLTTSLIALLAWVPQPEMATITSMSYLFRALGSSIGITGTAAIFQGVVNSILSATLTGPDAEQMIEIARKSVAEARQILPQDVLEHVLVSYKTAIQCAFAFCLAGSITGFVVAFYLEDRRLSK